MGFQPDKCSVLPITKSRTPVPHTYTLHGHNLQEVSSTRYLGVMLQSDTKFNHHIDSIITKAIRTLAFLRRNLKIGSTQIKGLACKALVRPLLEYASSVWDPNTKKDTVWIEAVQRRAARFILHRHYNTSSVDEMLQLLGWSTLKQRRRVARLTMLYKIFNKQAQVDSPELQLQRQTRARQGHDQCY